MIKVTDMVIEMQLAMGKENPLISVGNVIV